MISQLKQAVNCRFKFWPTGSCRLLYKMGPWPSLESYEAYTLAYSILTMLQKQKHPLPLPDLSSLLPTSLQYNRTPAVPELLSFGDSKTVSKTEILKLTGQYRLVQSSTGIFTFSEEALLPLNLNFSAQRLLRCIAVQSEGYEVSAFLSSSFNL